MRCSWSRTRRYARGHIALLAPPTCGETSSPGQSRAGVSGQRLGHDDGARSPTRSAPPGRRPPGPRATLTQASASGSSAGSSEIACTPSRAERATRTTEHSNGAAGPRWPRRSRRTRPAARSCPPARVPARSTRAVLARTNSGTPRSEASTSVSASSAVEVSWMPRPLQRVTPSGRDGCCRRRRSGSARPQRGHPRITSATPARRVRRHVDLDLADRVRHGSAGRPPRSESAGGSPSSRVERQPDQASARRTPLRTLDTTRSCQVTALASVSEATWSITTRSRAASSAAAPPVVGEGPLEEAGRVARPAPRPARRPARAGRPSARPGRRPA